LAHLQHGVFTYYVLAHWRDDPGEVTDLTLVQYVDAELEKARLPRLVRGVTDQGRLVLRAPRPSVFTVPYPRNPLFVGRADVLADLAARLGGPRTPVLAGLGGQGKTQIAVELAYRLRERYPGGVFWLTMDSDGGVRSQVAAFAGPTVLALPGHDTLTFDERVATVRHAWEESVLRLLIFDNLEDSALLHWRPRVGGSHVLGTSRNAEWSALDGVDLLLLDALPRPLSVDLLLTPRARRRQTTVPALLATAGAASAADTICEALADLPLALTLAAAHLEWHDQASVTRYSRQLQQARVADESLNAEFKGQLPTGHEPGILATFALGYDQLDPTQATHTLALTILHRAAHAAAAPIPADLLVRLADRDPADEDAADAVDQAVQRLAALGLIERLPDASARLHRLLAAYTRHRAPDPADDADALESALITAAEQLWEAGYPQAAQPYLPHLRAAATAATRTDPPAATLLNNLAGLLQAQGDYAAARLLFERALAIREQALGPSHPDTATSLNNLADLLRAQGDYGAARPFFERALAIDEAAYGPTHPDVATDLNNLAILLQDMGDYAAARLLYKRALTIREQVLGSSHPYTATSLNNLAGLLRMQKDYGAARPLYERALTIREQALGPTHPDTAQSLNNLALLLQDIRNYAAARPFLERALAIYEQTLGATHPDTATSLNNLAALLQTHGDYAAARPLYERALAINEAVYGPRHPAVAISLNNLAGLLQDQNDRNTARALYERALAMAEQTLGPTHPTTQAIRQNLRNL
jgi:tetratricopeptide (TPR) repeat protein